MFKEIIISLDGFDINSEVFREYTQRLPKDSDEYAHRQEYEWYFFRTLIEVVTKFKNDKFRNPMLSTFKAYLDFCIILPKDRYDQIIEEDRDSAKWKFGSLVWDAYDLLELIVLRLEYLISRLDNTVKFDKKGDIFKRFDRALDFFPAIPKEITINIDGYNHKMGIFNYLLRASFWRPRDIISNFSYILAYAIPENNVSIIQNMEPLENELLELTIKANARKIIQKELIGEYRNVFRNLDMVLHRFMDSEIIVNAEIFCSKLSQIPFDASYAYNLNNTGNKLYVLYQLGLIGLYFDKNTAKTLGYLHHICFNFNAGLEPIRHFNRSVNYKKANAKIMFNPILCEKLSLKINTSELLCDWTPEYIIRLHKMKSIIHAM